MVETINGILRCAFALPSFIFITCQWLLFNNHLKSKIATIKPKNNPNKRIGFAKSYLKKYPGPPQSSLRRHQGEYGYKKNSLNRQWKKKKIIKKMMAKYIVHKRLLVSE